VRLAQAFTNQIAVALHNARLALKEREAQTAARRQLDRLSELSRVTELLLASHDLPSVEKVIVEAAVALSGARASVLALVKPGQQRLLMAATHGDMHGWFDSFADPHLDAAFAHPSPTGEAIVGGKTVLVSDYLARPAVTEAQVLAGAAGVRSLIAAPVRKSGSLLGMLWVADTQPKSLIEEDALVIESLADQAALALEQARLLDESHTLQVIAAELASTREPAAMIEAIVDRSAAALSADGCALWLAGHDRQRLVLGAASGLSPRFWSGMVRLMADDPPSAAAAYRGMMGMTQPVYNADDPARVRQMSAALADILAEEGVTSALRLPLFEPEGDVAGMLALYHRRNRVYSDSELRLAQAFADQIAVGLHNSRLAEKQREAQGSAKRQLERLTAITRITERLLGATELDSVLRVVVESAARLSGASGAMVGLVDDEGRRLQAVAFQGEPRAFYEQFGSPLLDEAYLRDTATGRALASGVAVVVEDYTAWPAQHPARQETIEQGVRAFVAAPLLLAGRPIGALWIHDTRPRTFAPDDVALVEALADQAALAIEHARLAQQGQDAAVLEERTRLARDLHDSVTQSVFSLGMMARAAQTQFARGSDRLGTTLDRIAELSGDALREMRALLFELQPTGLAEEGLTGALRRLADAVRTRTELDVCFEGATSVRLSASVETAAFRIVQEALANATKHAKATSISIVLEESPAMVQICVEDNGVGFDPAAPVVQSTDGTTGGMGMRTMHERAAASGLLLRISSAPGTGTTVTVEAPRPHEGEEPAEAAAGGGARG
jgi:signal transduction histidine kinase